MIQNVVKGYRVLTDDEKKRLEGLYGEKNRQSLPDDLQEVVKRGFAIEKEVVKNSLLFLSMNPSFSDNSWNNGTEEGENAYYNIPDLKNKISPKETNSFFQAINRFYKNLNINPQNPLAHHDLLFIRETNQKRVLDWKAQLDKKNTFFSKQLNLSKIIIEDSQPKMIVVLNAGARVLFKELFDEDNSPSFNNKFGAYIYSIKGHETPVLFSGMLSGQRALDLGSQESLKWHIEHIYRLWPIK